MNPYVTVENLNDRSKGHLTDFLGLEALELKPKRARSRMEITSKHLSPTGYLHAAAIIAMADTTCGWGTYANLPDDSQGFTTLELKSNFLGTLKQGLLYCEAVAEHIGRSTQIWSATVTDSAGKRIALFRCSQIVLYPNCGNLDLRVD
jgi:1,4-dihydroxy-2-naphthoyl-CoA hydrolase